MPRTTTDALYLGAAYAICYGVLVTDGHGTRDGFIVFEALGMLLVPALIGATLHWRAQARRDYHSVTLGITLLVAAGSLYGR